MADEALSQMLAEGSYRGLRGTHLCHQYKPLVEDICDHNAAVEEKPGNVPVSFSGFAPDSVVLPELVSSVHSPHIAVIGHNTGRV